MDTSTCLKRCLQVTKFVRMYSAKKSWQCRTTVQISPTDEFTEKVNNHTHAPSPTQVEVIKVKVGMKCKAKTTEETVQP